MRAVLQHNPRAGEVPGPAPTRTPLDFHRRLPGYEPTPLVDAAPLARELGIGHVWLKDETERLGLPSFKVMGASWGVIRALSEHVGEDLSALPTVEHIARRLRSHGPLTLAAATDGNHGRALARLGSMLGLAARIFVPAAMAPARRRAIAGEGADLVIVEGGYDDAVARAAGAAGRRCLVISDTSWPGYEDTPRHVIDGYSTILWEVGDELERRGEPPPDLVLAQLGVGAFAAAVARHLKGNDGHCRVVGVEPLAADCVRASLAVGRIVTVATSETVMSGLHCGTASLVAWPYVEAGLDAILAIDDAIAVDGVRRLARLGVL
ncbi:MAG: pyridoxal-phosphate dependent enzyme, partial [Thermoleophilaceae bacterium]